MSRYTLDFFNCEWCVSAGTQIVFQSPVYEEAECMLEEFRYYEQDAESNLIPTDSEFDYV